MIGTPPLVALLFTQNWPALAYEQGILMAINNNISILYKKMQTGNFPLKWAHILV